MSTPYLYAFVGLTAMIAMLVGVLTFAALRFAAAARDSGRHLRGAGAETAFLSAALQEAVTKLRTQEQAMSARAEASERLSGQIVSSLTAGLLVVNEDGDVAILNPAGCRLLGIEEGPARSPYQSLLAHAPPLVDALDECLRTGRPIVRRALGMPKGSRVSHFGVTVSLLRGGGGKGQPSSHGAICLFSDLTQVMELEEQLRLKDTLARLGELTAGIAHEFRNGLATIHGYSRLMTPEELPETYRPYVAAFVLFQELQLRADRTALRGAQVPRRRQALITVGVQVVRSVRRIVLHFPRSHPDAATWACLARVLGAAPA